MLPVHVLGSRSVQGPVAQDPASGSAPKLVEGVIIPAGMVSYQCLHLFHLSWSWCLSLSVGWVVA